MRVVQVMPFFNEAVGSLDQVLARYPLVRELPASLAARGHDITVLSLAPESAWLSRGGVRYAFIAPNRVVAGLGRRLHRWKPRYGPAYYQPSWRLVREVKRLDPDVVHVFGLTMDLQLAALLAGWRGRGAPVIAHYHGGLPATTAALRRIQRFNLRRLAKVCFTAARQAQPWIEAGLLRPSQVAEVIETSSPFSAIPREEARQRTGMRGDPVCLSAGRLDPIKDPLTMLRGFARIASERPAARLYCYYLTDAMLAEMRELVASEPALEGRVEFRGCAPLEEMEAVYSSADFLLQASVREWSGLAVLEAMSCGCIPVVSCIPAFQAMTDDGSWGRLFDISDDAGLAGAVLALNAKDAVNLSERVRRHFQAELSFDAMAAGLETLYSEAAGSSAT